MPNVYHFILDHRIGGPHIYATSIGNALKKTVESAIVTTKQGPLTDIPLVNLRHLWKPFYILELPVNILLIAWMIISGRMKRVDSVFHVHQAANIAPLLSACLFRIPVVWQFHEAVPGFRLLVKIGLLSLKRTGHRVLAVAHDCKRVYGLPRVTVLPAIVDPEFWSLEKVAKSNRHTVGTKEDLFRLVAVGNMNPLKGFDLLLHVFEQLPGNWELRIVGQELETFRGYARDLKNKQHAIMKNNKQLTIQFMGWQSREKIRDMLASCDAFVMPSRSEACPIALLEAMAMETLCIASGVGEVPAMLGNGTCGVVSEPGNSHALRMALLNARQLPDTSVKQFCKAARRQVMRSYSLAPMSEKVLQIYSRLLADLK